MKKQLLSLLAPLVLLSPTATLASEPDVELRSAESQGCMLLRECTEGVQRIFHYQEIEALFDGEMFGVEEAIEVNQIIRDLDKKGVGVYLGPDEYFMNRVRGLYQTEENVLFLNSGWVNDPRTALAVLRHEGWHAAQDCMAGTIDNTYIAIIKPEEEVPMIWRELAERTYIGPWKNAVPWEAEASWAGREPGMTAQALRVCASNQPMWEAYEPTPMTREWLVNNGFIG